MKTHSALLLLDVFQHPICFVSLPSAILLNLIVPYVSSSSKRSLLSVPGACLRTKGTWLGPMAVQWWSQGNQVSWVSDLSLNISIMITDQTQQSRQAYALKLKAGEGLRKSTSIFLDCHHDGDIFKLLSPSISLYWETEGTKFPPNLWIAIFSSNHLFTFYCF